MKRSVLLILLTPLFLLLSSTALAQGIPSSIGGPDLSVSTTNPAPGQDVTITAKSYSVDINAATLTWTSAGKTLAKGVGVTSLTVKAPALGKKVIVNVTVVPTTGSSFTNSVTITSGSIDFIVEPGGYVPPLFRGKAPLAYQNMVKVVAIPHLSNSSGVEYDPKTLVYKWEQGTKVLEDQSGYGKQSVTIPGAIIPRPYDLTVTASTRDGNAEAMSIINISAGAPSISFYRNDPLYGPLFNSAIGRTIYLRSQREAGILAVPYGFNAPASGLGDLSLQWLINGIEHPELSAGKSVTLRSPEGASGSSNVSLSVTNKNDILQQADGGFSAVFSASATSTDSTASF